MRERVRGIPAEEDRDAIRQSQVLFKLHDGGCLKKFDQQEKSGGAGRDRTGA
jgi:hypothetical protein